MATQFTLDAPDQLLHTHHAGLIVNQESLRQMLGYFTLDQFDPIKVCWVGAGAARELRIVDGFTRTYAFVHHAETVRARYPDFHLTAIDVTAGLLRNPAIAEPDAATRSALTTTEYLRALIPPTVVHPEIADRRIAAYVVWAWNRLVGDSLAYRYSALAAVWFLQGMHWEYTSDKHTAPFLDGETLEERAAIEQGLLVLSRILADAILNHPRGARRMNVGEALFTLVMLADPALGDQMTADGQIYGLLYDPEITAKLRAATGTLEIEGQRAALGRMLLDLLGRTRRAGNGTRLDLIIAMLRSPDWALGDIHYVLQAADTETAYDQRQRDLILARWETAYRETYRSATLTQAELAIMRGITSTAAPHYPVQDVIQAVHQATTMMQRAQAGLHQIAQARMQAKTAGQDYKAYDPPRNALDYEMARLRAVESLTQLRDRTERLASRIEPLPEILDRIQQQIQITYAIDTEFAPELITAGPHAPEIRSKIQQAIKVSDTPEKVISQLRALDPDLLQGTLNGQFTPRVAGTLQTQRKPLLVPVVLEPAARTMPDPEAIRAACAALTAQLTGIDGSTLDAETTQALDAAAQAIGRVRYNVRDLPRLVLDEYPDLSRRYTRLLEQHTIRQSA